MKALVFLFAVLSLSPNVNALECSGGISRRDLHNGRPANGGHVQISKTGEFGSVQVFSIPMSSHDSSRVATLKIDTKDPYQRGQIEYAAAAWDKKKMIVPELKRGGDGTQSLVYGTTYIEKKTFMMGSDLFVELSVSCR